MNRKKTRSPKYSTILIIGLFSSLLTAGLFDRFVNNPPNKLEENIHKQEQESEKQTASVGQVKGESDTKMEKDNEIRKFKLPYINPPPEVSAKAYGVIDLTKNVRMYAKNPNLSLPPASVTKLMTAIVALDEYDLEKPVVVPAKCTNLNGSKVGLISNDVLTLKDLLYGLLVRSGADAACAIANITDEAEFIEKMNRKANELGMENTVFENEIGFDSLNYQFSSINDLIKLSKKALEYGTIRQIVGAKEVTLRSMNSNNIYKIRNTNNLLFNIPGTIGIKTGYTEDALGCLLYLYENKKQKILIVILGSEDRFGDTQKLLNWTKEQIELTKDTPASNFGG